ncbi:hypothetical protein NKH48_20665 [Mesorhizobium sp. M1233]|uniref:hypothetical protein n=1 Tax=Mesorhizobium sp. M1233 TaxID=2957072 RepID=UPI00333A0BBE
MRVRRAYDLISGNGGNRIRRSQAGLDDDADVRGIQGLKPPCVLADARIQGSFEVVVNAEHGCSGEIGRQTAAPILQVGFRQAMQFFVSNSGVGQNVLSHTIAGIKASAASALNLLAF